MKRNPHFPTFFVSRYADIIILLRKNKNLMHLLTRILQNVNKVNALPVYFYLLLLCKEFYGLWICVDLNLCSNSVCVFVCYINKISYTTKFITYWMTLYTVIKHCIVHYSMALQFIYFSLSHLYSILFLKFKCL